MSRSSTKERKAKLRVAIKTFNDELLNLVKIQDKMEKVYPINEQQVVEIEKLYDEIWKLDESIKNLETLLEKSSSVEEERQLKKRQKNKKIKGLRAELECKHDVIIQEGSETFEIILGLYHKRLSALYELDLKTRKLVKLGVSQTEIYAVK